MDHGSLDNLDLPGTCDDLQPPDSLEGFTDDDTSGSILSNMLQESKSQLVNIEQLQQESHNNGNVPETVIYRLQPNESTIDQQLIQLSPQQNEEPNPDAVQLITLNGSTLPVSSSCLQPSVSLSALPLTSNINDTGSYKIHNIQLDSGEIVQVSLNQDGLMQLSKAEEMTEDNEEHDVESEQHTENEALDDEHIGDSKEVVDMVPVSCLTDPIDLLASTVIQDLPSGCPTWAARLRDCEKIGDAFRGWVENDAVLDLLLNYHKRYSGCLFGTRQSPNNGKGSTRLMWRSQYVPFDGIPFVNAGSRATVMECQYGPRRKGAHPNKIADEQGPRELYKKTCPARIYVKRVRKFPQASVDISGDRKMMKMAMDRSFLFIKTQAAKNGSVPGQERIYVQLPSLEAHEYHIDEGTVTIEEPLPSHPSVPILPAAGASARLHPGVREKLRQLVSSGMTELYAIRKQLRTFVDRDLFGGDFIVEKHNLTFYPTVNDLQNHIHQAIKDIAEGTLTSTAPPIAIEESGPKHYTADIQIEADGINWDTNKPHPENVTVTVTQNPGDDGFHVISRVETHLSDGTTEVASTFSPEMIQLLSKLHPQLFNGGTLMSTDISGGDINMLPDITSDPTIMTTMQSQSDPQSDPQSDQCDNNISSTRDPELGPVTNTQEGAITTVNLNELPGAILSSEGSVTLQAINVEDNLMDLQTIADVESGSKEVDDTMPVFT